MLFQALWTTLGLISGRPLMVPRTWVWAMLMDPGPEGRINATAADSSKYGGFNEHDNAYGSKYKEFNKHNNADISLYGIFNGRNSADSS